MSEELAKNIEENLWTDDLLANPLQHTLGTMTPFFFEDAYTPEHCAELAFRALKEKGGNVSRWDTIDRARRHRLGEGRQLPSASQWRNQIIRLEGECQTWGPWKHNASAQQELHADVHVAAARFLAHQAGWVDGSHFFVLDESPNRGSGKLNHDVDEDTPVEETGFLACPIFRKRGNSGPSAPFFRGSTGGIEPLHAAVFGVEHGETATAHIDFFAKFSKKSKAELNPEYCGLQPAVERCMQQIYRIGPRPLFGAVDKGFTGNGAVWETIRDHTDPAGTIVLGPAPRNVVSPLRMEQIWEDELCEPINIDGEDAWVAADQCSWSKSSGGYRPFTVIFLFVPVPESFKEENPHGDIVQEGASDSERIWCFPVMTNAELVNSDGDVDYITLQNILKWLRRRWAIESLFERFKTRFGRGQAQDLLPWQLQYNMAFGIITAWHTWRITKRRQYPGISKPALSLSCFIGDVLGCLDDPSRTERRPPPS